METLSSGTQRQMCCDLLSAEAARRASPALPTAQKTHRTPWLLYLTARSTFKFKVTVLAFLF